MDAEKYKKIALVAQKISFAFEDSYTDIEKRELFNNLFNKYLMQIDPEEKMEPYDAIIQLGDKEPRQFENLVKEMEKFNLIED